MWVALRLSAIVSQTGDRMKVLFFMGRNSSNRSGVSWKIWKIRRKGRVVTVSWGPARHQGASLC